MVLKGVEKDHCGICSGCEMPKIIEVEWVVMGKVGGEGDNWGKQHKNVGGVEMKFSRLA